jgi:hypothetical protein
MKKDFSSIFVYLNISLMSCWKKSMRWYLKKTRLARKHDESALGCVWTRLSPLIIHRLRTASIAVRRGTFRHVAYQTLFSLRIPHGDGPCRIVQERTEAWSYECTYKYSTKECLSYCKYCSGSGQTQMESSCERGKEPSGPIKCWETTEWLNNLCPLEWCSAPHT